MNDLEKDKFAPVGPRVWGPGRSCPLSRRVGGTAVLSGGSATAPPPRFPTLSFSVVWRWLLVPPLCVCVCVCMHVHAFVRALSIRKVQRQLSADLSSFFCFFFRVVGWVGLGGLGGFNMNRLLMAAPGPCADGLCPWLLLSSLEQKREVEKTAVCDHILRRATTTWKIGCSQD